MQEDALVWSLGDCDIQDETTIIFNFEAVLQDAASDLTQDAIKKWRTPVFEVGVGYNYTNGRKTETINVPVGKDIRQIKGSLIHFDATPTNFSKVDAGDVITLTGTLENKGDQPVKAVYLALSEDADSVGSKQMLGCDQSTISIDGQKPEKNCNQNQIVSSTISLRPLEKKNISINAVLDQSAPTQTQSKYLLQAYLLDEGSNKPTALKNPVQSVMVSTRSIARPLWSFSKLSQQKNNTLLIGHPFELEAIFSFPEGYSDVDEIGIDILLDREEGTDQESTDETDYFKVVTAELKPTSSDLKTQNNIQNINNAAEREVIDVTQQVEIQSIENGVRVTVPLGGVQTTNNTGKLRNLRYLLSLKMLPIDSPPLTEGQSIAGRAFMDLADDTQLSSTQTAFAHIAEPYIEIASTVDDPDRLAHNGEIQPYRINVCNRGTAPAFDLRFTAILDADLKYLDHLDSILKSSGGQSIGSVSYNSSDRSVDIQTDWGKALLAGECVQAEFAAVVQSGIPDDVGISIDDIYYGSQTDGQSEYKREYSAPAKTFQIPVTRFYGEAPKEIHYDSNNIENIDIPFALFLPADLLSTAPQGFQQQKPGLQLSAQSSLGLQWVFIQDTNKNLLVDPGEPLWNARNSVVDWSSDTLSFIARAQSSPVLNMKEWADTTQIKASLLRQSGQSQVAFMQTVSTANQGGEIPLSINRLMALDRNCNNSLADETAQDALFEISKAVQIGECLRIQILYTNTLDQARQNVKIQDVIPAQTRYVEESAVYVLTPRGLETIPVQFNKEQKLLSWSLQGTLLSDLEGILEYTVQIYE
jgi:uncharacterized repeat protein (TIGR01451 family)